MISPFKKAIAPGDLGAVKKRSAGPCSSTCPLLRNKTRSARRRAWPRSWVLMMIRAPAALASHKISSISRVERPSRLEQGSSRNTVSGRRIKARARASFCCSPPDKRGAGTSSSALSPIRAPNAPHARKFPLSASPTIAKDRPNSPEPSAAA